MARNILALKKRAKESGIPAIYVNDNFGRWQSNFHTQVEHCLEDGVTGRPIVRIARPRRGRLLRAQAQALGVLLDDPRHPARIPAGRDADHHGIAANICVLFTANDAYMRDFG